METLRVSLPDAEDRRLAFNTRHDQAKFFKNNANNTDVLFAAMDIMDSATNVFTRVCKEQGKTGALFAFSKGSPGSPVVASKIGEVNAPDENYRGGKAEKYLDFVTSKINFLLNHPNLNFSSQNAQLEPNKRALTRLRKDVVPGGAVRFTDSNGEEWILSSSGLSSDPLIDTLTTIEIGIAAGLTPLWSK